MPTKTSYPQGTPCWVDLQTTDQPAAKNFYGELFGWTYDDQQTPQGAVYSMGQIDGQNVAAIAPQTPEMVAAGAPPMWNTYLAVDNVDAVTASVAGAGGQVAMEPFDVMDGGRMSFIADPTGAFVGLWQANQHIGAQLVNEFGTLTWNELVTADQGAALPFYSTVFGISSVAMDMGEGYSYTMLQVGDQQIGGSTAPQAEGVPNHWNVWFSVESADDTAALASKLGGTVLLEPMDMPVGRMAIIADPQGAIINILQPAPQNS